MRRKRCSNLAYVLITPYSLLKSRTGGIIGRLLSLSSHLQLVGARMYAPGDEMLDKYCETIQEQKNLNDYWKNALINYINNTFRRKNQLGISNRTMMLLFKGKNAVNHLLNRVIGSFTNNLVGNTVRGTYGDFLAYPDGTVEFFEPAVLTAGDPESNYRQLKILAEYAETDGGIVDWALTYPKGTKVETTFVMIKPDSLKEGSSRAGNIIDMFSRTGLYIVGAKLLRLSIAQASEFYAPLRKLFVEKLKPGLADKLKETLDGNLKFKIDRETYLRLADVLKELNATAEFNEIVKFMTGLDPEKVGKNEAGMNRPGNVKCLALLYQGKNAVRKVRRILGGTDPGKTRPGTVRWVYGYDLMRNAAHASDSPRSAAREGKIVGLWRGHDDCDIKKIIEAHL